jgi:hypothetical protein
VQGVKGMSKQKTKRELFNEMNYIERTKRQKEPPKPGIGLIIWTILKLFGGALLLICELLLIILTCVDLQTALREGKPGFTAILQLLNIFSAACLGIYVMSDAARRNRLKISIQMKKDAFRRTAKKYIWKLRVFFNKKTRAAK